MEHDEHQADDRKDVYDEIDNLVGRLRPQVFWYARDDWYPSDDRERLYALMRIAARVGHEGWLEAHRLTRRLCEAASL